ncbi:TPA: amidase [Candidatus Poribacteria bacterium]|nr:amidase [Candidatus Poribacteria bacterium]
MHFNTIVEVAKLIQSKQLSPIELTQMQLERIQQWDPHLKSYATLMAGQAMDTARQAEAEIMSGHYRGPLHGVPIAVKDLCYTRGVRTMGGAQVKVDHVPNHDATVVQKLAGAGAILLGKLNLTEGAMGGYNPAFPIPINPWHPERWTGSSSSGSGVATASGICFGSLGSDTGGSIRFPSAACGVVGLKPTWGRVSRYGVLALAESMDHIGTMTRSVADAGLMLHAIAGPDPNDPTTLPHSVPEMLDKLGQGLTGIRIGFDQHYATSDVDPELVAAVGDSVDVLVDLGAELVEIELPDIDPFVLAWPVLCTAEAVLAHQATYPLQRETYGPWFRGWLDKGANVTGADYARANNLRVACNGHFQRAISEIDILVCPSMSAPPHPVTAETLYGPMTDRPPKFQRFTVPFNYNGMPTLSLPCGFTSDHLPLSLQLVGKHLSEPLLCQVGHAYQQASTWHQRHPDLERVRTAN